MVSNIKIERRGYNRFQVEDIVNGLEKKVSELTDEIESLKQQLDILQKENARMSEQRDLIEATLINAEISARERLSRANEEADLIKQKAADEAKAISQDYTDRINELEDVQKRVEYVLRSQLSVVEKIGDNK